MANTDGDITLKIGVVADDARKVASDLHKYMEKTLNKPIDTKAFDGIKKSITETAVKSEKLNEELRTLKSTGADLGFNEQFKQLSESANIAQKKYFALRREAKAMRQAGNIPGAEELEKQVAIADAQRRQLLSQKMTLANTGRFADSTEFGEKTVQLTELNNQMVLYIKQLERMRSLEATRKQVATATQSPEKATPKKGLSETEDKARVLTESIEQLRRKLEGTDKSIGFLKMDKSIQKTIDDTNALKSTFEQMRAEVYKVTPTEEFTQASAKVKTLQQDVEKYHTKLMELEEMGKTHTQPYADTVFKWNQAQNSLITQLQLMRQMTAAGEDYNRVLWTETEEYNAAITKQQQLNRDLEIGKQRLKESAEYQAYRDKHTPSTPQDVKKEGEEAQQTSKKLNELEGQKKRTTRANSELGEESEETASKMRQEKSAAERLKETFVTFGRGVKTIGKGMVTVARATGNFVNRLRGVHKGTDDASKSIKNLLKFSLKYFLGLRSIFILYKRIRSAGVEAYKGLASQFPELQAEVNELKNSFFQLKNSLATMAQPILSALVPAIKTLMGWLSAAMTALANFFAILTGAKYIYKASKANKDWAKSAGGAGKAAKEANEDIAEYDNLILIQQDKDNGGGGGGGAADDYAGAFEKVKAESDLAKEIKDAIEKGDWEGVGVALGKRLNTVTSKLDNWINTKFRPAAKKWAGRVAQILNGLTSTWDSALTGKTLADGLMAIYDTIATFYETYKFKNLGQKVGTAITSFFTNWEPDTVARRFAGKFNAVINFVAGLIDKEKGINFKLIGQKLGQTLKRTIERIEWKQLGADLSGLATGILESLATFIKESKVGTTVGNAINEFLSGIDFGQLAKDLSDVAINIMDAIADLLETIDWTAMGQAIADFLKNIDWGKFLETLAKVALALVKGLGTALLQIATDPEALGSIATGLLTIFGAKWIWGKITGLFKTGLTDAITQGAASAGGGSAVGGWLRNLFTSQLGSGGLATTIGQGLIGGLATFQGVGSIYGNVNSVIATIFNNNELAKEYQKFSKNAIGYTIDTVKECYKAADEYSEITGGFTLDNAIGAMFSDGGNIDKALADFTEKQDKLQEEGYKAYMDMIDRRIKAGKMVNDNDRKLLAEFKGISTETISTAQSTASHYEEIAKRQAGVDTASKQTMITNSNHYAQIAQKNAITHDAANRQLINSSNHHALIAQQNAQKVTKSDNDMITSSNHYVQIAQQNANAVSTNANNMATNIKTAVSTVPTAYDTTFTNAYNKVTGAFSGIKTFFSGVADGVKSPFSTMADYFKTTFTNSWNGVVSVFQSNSPQFQSIQDSVSGVFKSSINSMIGGINNSLLSPFRTLSNAFAKMRGFNINGASPFGSLPSFNVPNIPKLAQGAVLPPNSPFLAVVGDQKSGTNVEAPLDTIVQALQIALENNNNNQPIILNLNGRQVAQAVWDEENKRYKQTGLRYRNA